MKRVKPLPSLQSQLILAMALFFALAISGLFAGHWLSIREYVEKQLASHAQDAASSLALALSSALEQGDVELARITVLPLFDRGYYRSVALRDNNGKMMFEYHIDNTELKGVPVWFRRFANLRPPPEQAVVSTGWRQIGHVEVVSEPRFAYEYLWRGTLQMAGWVILLFGILFLTARVWLRRLLFSLGEIERAAQGVAERHFVRIDAEPRTRELHGLVAGFNRLVDAVRQLLGNEEERAERFRIEALADPLTGVLNHRGLNDLFEQGGAETDWLGFVKCEDIAAVNREQGYQAGNELISALAKEIQKSFPEAALARTGAAEFALVLQESASAQDLCGRYAAFQREAELVVAQITSQPKISVGWAQRWQREPCEWMAAADVALRQAQQSTGVHCIIEQAAPDMTSFGKHGAVDWAHAIRQAISTKRVRLKIQPVITVNPGGEPQILHREVFTAFIDELGVEIPAIRWWGMASRQGMLYEVDKAMLAILVSYSGPSVDHTLSINLSSEAWTNRDFIEGLPLLRQRMKQWRGLVFEIREDDAVRLRYEVRHFRTAARQAGFGVAIDRFGITSGSIACLRELLPDYVKLDVSAASEIGTDSGRFFMESLAVIARTLEIPVLVQILESVHPPEKDTMLAQGFVFGAVETVGA